MSWIRPVITGFQSSCEKRSETFIASILSAQVHYTLYLCRLSEGCNPDSD